MCSWRCFPFVDSTPRAYRLKASNAAPSISTSTGTFPLGHEVPHTDDLHWCIGPPLKGAFAKLLNTTDEAVIDRALALYRGCRPECGWNFARGDLRQLESIESGGEVNRLIACQRLPSIDLAHADLT